MTDDVTLSRLERITIRRAEQSMPGIAALFCGQQQAPDTSGSAEAVAQIARCAAELGYVGEPAALAVAVGDACLAFARELREINARYMATVKRLEAEVDALTLAQEEALTAFREHGWTGTIPDGPAAVPAHARDLIRRHRELAQRLEARTASLLPDEIADLRQLVNAAACQGEITARRNDELVGALARCQDDETARLRRELAAAEKLADAWKANAFALRAAHVRREDIAADRLGAVASPASPHSMQTDSETGTIHLGFSMPQAGGLAICLTRDDAVRLRGWLINAAGLPSIEPRERSLRAVSGAAPETPQLEHAYRWGDGRDRVESPKHCNLDGGCVRRDGGECECDCGRCSEVDRGET